MALSAKRRKELIELVKDHLGLTKFWKAFILSIVGLVLLGLVLAILISVKVSGAEGSDDILVPLLFVAGLLPLLIWGIVSSRRKIQDLRRGELHQALTAEPTAVSDVSVEVGRWGTHVFITLRSGRKLRLFLDHATAEEVAAWLGGA